LRKIIRKDLPQAPKFEEAKITIEDAPHEPQTILYRNVLECADFLFQNPRYREHMIYEPSLVFGADDKNRIYSDISDARLWNECQVSENLRRHDKDLK